jgi:hypothetical protein
VYASICAANFWDLQEQDFTSSDLGLSDQQLEAFTKTYSSMPQLQLSRLLMERDYVQEHLPQGESGLITDVSSSLFLFLFLFLLLSLSLSLPCLPSMGNQRIEGWTVRKCGAASASVRTQWPS